MTKLVQTHTRSHFSPRDKQQRHLHRCLYNPGHIKTPRLFYKFKTLRKKWKQTVIGDNKGNNKTASLPRTEVSGEPRRYL